MSSGVAMVTSLTACLPKAEASVHDVIRGLVLRRTVREEELPIVGTLQLMPSRIITMRPTSRPCNRQGIRCAG
jgi:hypothetical protein